MTKNQLIYPNTNIKVHHCKNVLKIKQKSNMKIPLDCLLTKDILSYRGQQRENWSNSSQLNSNNSHPKLYRGVEEVMLE